MLTDNPTSQADPVLVVRRAFPAPREQVFRAWTEAQALEGWFKPEGQQTHVVQLDLCVGGSYQFDFRTMTGEQSSVSGTYLEIVPPEKLVFTWLSLATDDRETLVTVEFVERSGVTEVVLTHERLSDGEMVTQHRFGWNWMIDRLEGYL